MAYFKETQEKWEDEVQGAHNVHPRCVEFEPGVAIIVKNSEPKAERPEKAAVHCAKEAVANHTQWVDACTL